ncbi:MAG TPA: M12 family metallo-peptidase [Saprospiraceae bacterium]|nr:M12 family metallo-peptidase [Saprospiraceae bacterium]HNA63887.1 M12 family metallo-peptidase [Saprospiraceae bacterium]HNF10847.1 M12 family metallo-peptidase [Saprospiraceae bacterium]
MNFATENIAPMPSSFYRPSLLLSMIKTVLHLPAKVFLPVFILSLILVQPILHGQGQVALDVREAQQSHQTFTSITLFEKVAYHNQFLAGSQFIQDVVTTFPVTSVCTGLLRSKPTYLALDLPLPDNTIGHLLLIRQEVYGPESRLLTPDDPVGQPMQGGVFYRGIIEGDERSLVALSVFEDELMGVVSNDRLGNVIIGRQHIPGQDRSQTPHVIYQESALPIRAPFQCGTDELPILPNVAGLNPGAVNTYPTRCKSVKIFLECSYRLFTDRGSSQGAVQAYMTGLFNVVKTLYANEKVVIEISDIMVWTSQDPYLTTTLANIIYDYANRRKNNFNGTLAQLVTTFPIQQQGGIAFVDGMCKTWDGQSGPLSFAFINNTYSSLPTYSWSVEVMTHEMGHNFGSWHTHSCVWGPNHDSQIDNCQPADIGSCNNGVAPNGGGTIMSYCHLTSYGINFSKGFGTEPGDILRNSFATKSCIPSTFTPVASHSIKGPYFEGDSFRLAAKPYNKNYKYEWLHYDYIFNKNNDTAVTLKTGGIYTLAISSTNCTEYSKPDTIQFGDFTVNLGCPVNAGHRDSLYRSVTLNVDNAAYTVDSLTVPEGWLDSIPSGALDRLVELQMTITPKGASFTRSVVSQYESPAAIGISNNSYTPNDQVAFGQKSPMTFSRILGSFDPKGVWKFSGIDIRNDAGIDAVVQYKIVLKWRFRDTVVSCDVPLCDNRTLVLDAGIPNASYVWNTGATSRSISANKPGPVGVTVTKNGFTSSHEINLVSVNTSFPRNISICEGDSIIVKNKVYKKPGVYRDTFQSGSGCDSIIITTLDTRAIIHSSETLAVCYGDIFRNVNLVADTIITVKDQASNGCDSLHAIHFEVNPRIVAELHYDPACNNIGTDLNCQGRGGSGTLRYLWSTGDTTAKLTRIKSGTYRVIVKDNNGCFGIFEQLVQNYDSVAAEAGITDVSCFGGMNGQIKINVTGGTRPFSYIWNNGVREDLLKDLVNGTYHVVIIDANGCRFEGDYSIHSPDLLFVNADVKPSFGSNGSIELMTNGGVKPYRYAWSQGDTTSLITGLTPGTYTVTVTDDNGCSSVQTYDVQNKVSTKNPVRDAGITIAPVPVHGMLTIRSSSSLILGVSLTNAIGQELLRQPAVDADLAVLDLSGLDAGYYLLIVTLQNGRIVERKILKY